MHILLLLELVLQVLLAVHAARRDRTSWVWIVLVVPLAWLVYLVAVVLPELAEDP